MATVSSLAQLQVRDGCQEVEAT